jgi:quercetin dioxygenase-like cupin family protein
MIAGRASRAAIALIGAVPMLAGCAAAGPPILAEQPRAANVAGGCSDPAAGRDDRTGCYLTATRRLGRLPATPLFWHVYTFPDRRSAAAERSGRGDVVEAFGRTWLYAIEPQGWRPRRGARMAVIGPLGIRKGVTYVARYMEATFPPGLRTGSHAHSGPEAWYVLTGAQCLQTPDRTIIARAGDSALIPEGPPMVLSSIGAETRRSVLLVLHDASRPWTGAHAGWHPPGPCRPA